MSIRERDDGAALARRIRAREVTATEAVEAAIERVRWINPSINAVVTENFERALSRAEQLDRVGGNEPLHGVPYFLKDLGVAVAGQPLYLGNRALKDADFRPDWTSELALRFDRLGLVLLGTTNTSEMGAQTTTQPLAWGPTRNPWDLTCSASGSSGGSAAAVATGLVPVAHGNDYLGSIRLPAAWNGVLGMIASRGRVPIGPRSVSRMSREFVLARTVRDLAIVLDGVNGREAGALFVEESPSKPYTEAINVAPTALQIGLLTDAPDGGPVDAEMVAAVKSVGNLLESLGHRVTLDYPAALLEDRTNGPAYDRGSDYRRRIRIIETLLGRTVSRDDVEPFLWEMGKADGETVDASIDAQIWEQEWSWRVTSWWERDGYDLLVTPTVPMFPEALDELAISLRDPKDFFANHMARHITFTAPFNITGQPAISIPWVPNALSADLPPSIQLVAARGRDDLVLATAAVLEAANPSVQEPPLISDRSTQSRPLARPFSGGSGRDPGGNLLYELDGRIPEYAQSRGYQRSEGSYEHATT